MYVIRTGSLGLIPDLADLERALAAAQLALAGRGIHPAASDRIVGIQHAIRSTIASRVREAAVEAVPVPAPTASAPPATGGARVPLHPAPVGPAPGAAVRRGLPSNPFNRPADPFGDLEF